MTREKNSCNYRMFNQSLGCYCGHMHHSRESAMRCADAMGWDKNLILVNYDSSRKNDRKKSVHNERRRSW